MKIVILLLIIGMSNGQLSPDWTAALQAHINQLTSNIQRNVNKVQEEVQENVRRLNQDISQRVGKINEEVAVLPNNGNSIVINQVGGSGHIIDTGIRNGEPYYYERVDRRIGDTLFRTEKIYNAKTNKMEISDYTLDLNDRNAKFVLVSARVEGENTKEDETKKD